MLMLTQGAAEAISVLAGQPGAEGLRISSAEAPQAEGEQALQIGVVDAPASDDAVLEAGGAQVFLASDTVETLSDKVLDADIEGQNVRFTLLEQEPPEDAGPSPDGAAV